MASEGVGRVMEAYSRPAQRTAAALVKEAPSSRTVEEAPGSQWKAPSAAALETACEWRVDSRNSVGGGGRGRCVVQEGAQRGSSWSRLATHGGRADEEIWVAPTR